MSTDCCAAMKALDNTPNPTTGLSERDIAYIRRSWAMLVDKKVRMVNAVELFVQLFAAFPNMRSFFKDFANLSDDEMRKCAKLRAHASSVMYMLSNYVDNLDDVDLLLQLVTKISKSHIRRNIAEKEFKELASIFVPFIRSRIGDENVTAETEVGWNKLLAAHCAIVKANMS